MPAFEGRHVVITGATGGLGGAVVAAFAAAGATCHLPVRRPPEAGAPPGARYLPGVDVTDEAAVARLYAALPPLWASVHLVGGFAMAAIEETPLAALRAQLDVNLVTAFLCSREAARVMRGEGRIVNVSSRAAAAPSAGLAAYVAAKAALEGLTRALAMELAPRGILVNAIAPSLIDTAANRAAMPDAEHDGWAKPAAIAQAVLFLAAPDNRLTTGAILPV